MRKWMVWCLVLAVVTACVPPYVAPTRDTGVANDLASDAPVTDAGDAANAGDIATANDLGDDRPATPDAPVLVDTPDAQDASGDTPAVQDVLDAPDVPCPTGQMRCSDGTCIDPNFDGSHCGGCERPACATGRVCVVGRCVVPPSSLGLGFEHTCLHRTSGARSCTWCWGNDTSCQLARGTRFGGPGDAGAPPPCTSLPNHPGAPDGSVPTCGIPVQNPLRVAGLPDNILSLSESGTCAVVSLGDSQPGGRVLCWGDNSAGQLGNGNWQRSATPVEVVLPDGNPRVARVSSFGTYAIGFTACALTVQGAIYCWGSNSNGQLGSATATCPATCHPLLSPSTATLTNCGQLPQRVQLPGDARASQITGGPLYACALAQSGAVYCWGYNDNGVLGFPGPVANVFPPETQAVTLPSSAQIEQISAAAGSSTTCALDRSGAVYCWGYQGSCQLGSGMATRFSATPVTVAFPMGTVIRRIAVGAYVTLALDSNGALWTWGRQGFGPFLPTNVPGASCDNLNVDAGGPGFVGPLAPVRADWFGVRTFQEIASAYQHSCAIDRDGGLWCWGNPVFPLGGTSAPSGSGVDSRVNYVGSLADLLACTP